MGNVLELEDAFHDRLRFSEPDEGGSLTVKVSGPTATGSGVILHPEQLRELRDHLSDLLGDGKDVEPEEGPGPEPGPTPMGVEERLIRSAKELLRAAVPEHSGDVVVFLEG